MYIRTLGTDCVWQGGNRLCVAGRPQTVCGRVATDCVWQGGHRLYVAWRPQTVYGRVATAVYGRVATDWQGGQNIPGELNNQHKR